MGEYYIIYIIILYDMLLVIFSLQLIGAPRLKKVKTKEITIEGEDRARKKKEEKD